MPIRYIVALFLVLLGFGTAWSQTQFRRAPLKPPVICKAGTASGISTRIPPPAEFLRGGDNARTKSATIKVVYHGFPDEARQAFEHAVAIWESLLVSPVEIRVAAVWANLPQGTLGSAGPAFWAANFEGAPRLNIYYPAALAEKLAGTDLNDPTDYDIVAQFNSSAKWHFALDGTPEPDAFDLITVVLHELGHGLGFTSTFEVSGGLGMYGRYTDNGVPFPFDLFVETGADVNLYEAFASPSTELAQQLTGNDLFFTSPPGDPVAKIFAPVPYSKGSSISHLDAASYPQGTENSLMRPFVNPNEVNHDPGPATQQIFGEIGWITTYIHHEHLADREDSSAPVVITASVAADGTPGYDFDDSAITLTYSRSDLPGTTEVIMPPGGEAGEFAATLPAPMDAVTYSYTISVPDTRGRVFYSPGLYYDPAAAPDDKGPSIMQYTFSVGADNVPPVITHLPEAFISYLDDELVIDVTLAEGSGISEALIEFILPGETPETTALELLSSERDPFEGTTLYHYRKAISLGTEQLQDGDIVQYRITTTDNAMAKNVSTYPEAGYVDVPVEGLAPSRTYYVNTFDTPSDDFIGSDFTVSTPAGFESAAIHSSHPYAEAGAGNELDLTYQLRIPIVVSSEMSIMSFDEVVIVEPGEDGSVFGDADFFDYVVVEGSADGGHTWLPLTDGYDARDYAPWVSAYNAFAAGNQTHYLSRTIDLQETFNPGDEVVIRFRLHSDPFGAGWGWAIDNLHIQTDDIAPEILHNHVDYLPAGAEDVALPVNVSDAGQINSLTFEYRINEEPLQHSEQAINQDEALVDYSLDIKALQRGDIIYYRYEAVDSAGNIARLPPDGFFMTPIVLFDEVVEQYSNTFDTPSNDFAGNFFEVTSTDNLPGPAIHSRHPYLRGFGTTKESDFTYMLLKKLRVSGDNPFMKFDEIVLVQPADANATFGTSGFHDYVVAEGSKDDGRTWHAFLEGYNARARSEWLAVVETGTGNQQLIRRRSFDLTASGDFVANDEILIRFRIFSDESVTGWGWTIDNLHIQDEVTAVPDDGTIAKFLMYPNPVTNANPLTIGLQTQAPGMLHVSILDAVGKEVYRDDFSLNPEMKSYPLHVDGLANGVYFIRLNFSGETITQKFVIAR